MIYSTFPGPDLAADATPQTRSALGGTMIRLLAATHGHVASTSPAHPLSVPVRHPSDKGSVVRDSGRSID